MTKVGYLSAPAFLACKHEMLDEDGWVRGGFVDYTLMEKLLDIPPPYGVLVWWYGRPERDQLREAFKKAWL